MSIKVLQIPSWFSVDGIIGSFFREQGNIFDKSEVDVRFLYGEKKEYGYKSWIFFLLHYKSKFEYKKVGVHNNIYSFEYPVFAFLTKDQNFKIKVWCYKKVYRKIAKEDNWKPDILHALSTFDGAIFADAINEIAAVPMAITEQNLFLLSNIDELRRDLGVKAIHHSKKVLTVSNDKSRQILMHGIKIDPVFVGNMANEDFFYFKPKPTGGIFTILIVAHFDWIKDYPVFFKALSLVAVRSSVPFKVNCVGYNTWFEGDNTPALQALAAEAGLDNVHYVPNVSREEISKYYWEADLFVLTSIAEGLPLSVLEALACGTPVVGTHCGGVEDVVNEVNGRVVPIKRPDLLAEKILDYLEKRILPDNARISNEILREYGKLAFCNKIRDIYKEMLQ